jgi:hypothetical protein
MFTCVLHTNKTPDNWITAKCMLKLSLRKFYGRHYDLPNRYKVYVSQMTMDMFHSSYSQFSPFLDHDLSPGL